MGNVARVFLRDLKRLAKAPAAWSVVLFLCVLPSLYTWFNVIGFWDPYTNTGNLRVCVVNEDEGADDDTLGQLDLGAQLVEQLSQDNRLGWAFMDRADAMAEVDAGSAYAAFVIPPDFSANITTLFGGDATRPQIQYYVNEKTGPVSPKITDTGASALDTSINDAFFSTVSSTVASVLNDKLDETREKAGAAKGGAIGKIDEASAGIREAREELAGISGSTQDAQQKAERAKASLELARRQLDVLASALSDSSTLIGQANTGLVKASGSANSALDKGSAEISQAAAQVNVAISQTSSAIASAKAAFGDAPAAGGDLDELMRKLDQAAEASAKAGKTLDDTAQQALGNVDDYRHSIASETVPAISDNLSKIATAAASIGGSATSQKVLVDQTAALIAELESTLAQSRDAIERTDRVLAGLEGDLSHVRTDVAALGTSSALADLIGENGVDADRIADFMMSPTQVQTEELYPLNAYGSAMAPLFINLTLWIGVFMLMVIVRIEVDDEGIKDLTTTQRFFGRAILLAIMAALQAVICCAGCLFIGVQTANVVMFVLTAVIASLTYLAIQYTLSATLQHIGKAICIILVFVQIPGATGLYPIEMTPDFFHVVYPLFPFTYGINAIRETISGFYGNSWAYYTGMLGLFFVVFTVIGALVRPYLTNLNRLFARQIEESDLINGESVQLPARRYRMSQVISAFADREEYRAGIEARVGRFVNLYPKLKAGGALVGVGVPLVFMALLGALHVDKVIILTLWLVWLILVITYLIVVEYLLDYLSHLVSLEAMSADEMRALYSARESLTRVAPIMKDLRRARFEGEAGTDQEGGRDA